MLCAIQRVQEFRYLGSTVTIVFLRLRALTKRTPRNKTILRASNHLNIEIRNKFCLMYISSLLLYTTVNVAIGTVEAKNG